VSHEVGVPLDLLATRQELLAVLQRRHEPLARRHDLEGPFAPLVEFDRVGDRSQFTDQGAALAQFLYDDGAHLINGLALELFVDGIGGRGVTRRPTLDAESGGQEAAVAADQGTRGQLQLAPPDDVGHVAEGADHRGARALLGVGQFVGHDRHLDAEERRHGGGAEEGLVARVVGVRDERDATGQHLGPGRLDLDGP
jgi:hypothetical protein